ncbi:unnamed protein product [Gongylonema pulchrum]|uniref:Radical SAM protein n=1 Tax=Gongylonema pulchrum TaxID=637853 RepID=A0A183D2Q5_9BILA|nr:unnamed protein product [Gongylonema pulchrum]
MCRQNYTFALVNDLFMAHPGIKTVYDKSRLEQLQEHSASQYFSAKKQFQQRMDEQYPETKEFCPDFNA